MSHPLEAGDLLTVRAALALVPIGRTLFYELIRDGQIPAIRVRAAGSRRGRLLVHRVDLARFVARARHEATRQPTTPDVAAIHARVRRDLAQQTGNPGPCRTNLADAASQSTYQHQGGTGCTTRSD